MSDLGLGALNPSENSAPKDAGQQRRTDQGSLQKQPQVEQDRIRYGVITKVNDNNLVKVRLLNNEGDPTGDEIAGGAYLPLINPLSQIFLLWGALRKGLYCRIFWRGRLDPDGSTLIEIIADEDHNFLKKQTESNEIGVGSWKIFSGGLSG